MLHRVPYPIVGRVRGWCQCTLTSVFVQSSLCWRVFVLVCVLFVWGGAEVRADMAPPRYEEQCTLQKHRLTGFSCRWCKTHVLRRKACQKQLASRGYWRACKVGGAAWWKELWCRTSRKQTLTPRDVVKQWQYFAKQNRKRHLFRFLHNRCHKRKKNTKWFREWCRAGKKSIQHKQIVSWLRTLHFDSVVSHQDGEKTVRLQSVDEGVLSLRFRKVKKTWWLVGGGIKKQ